MPPARTRSAADKPAELAPPFDIHAWLTGVDEGGDKPQYMTAAVKVCLKPYLATRLNNLVDQIEVSESGERTMGDASSARLRRDYDALLAEFDASRIVMTVRQTIPGDVESVRDDMDAAGVPRTGQNINRWLLSRVLVEPQLSPDEVEVLGERIGTAQFKQLIDAMDRLATELPAVSVPKSQRP